MLIILLAQCPRMADCQSFLRSWTSSVTPEPHLDTGCGPAVLTLVQARVTESAVCTGSQIQVQGN